MKYIERIKTSNKIGKVRDFLIPYVKRICQKPGVKGVVLLGGVADTSYRGFVDEFSDIDLTIFLDVPESKNCNNIKEFTELNRELLPKWVPEFSFYLPIPQLDGFKMEINIHQLLYQYERKEETVWSDSKKEAYMYTSEIIYDPTGEIKRLIFDKTIMSSNQRWERIITLAGQKEWIIDINPLRQIHRGFIMNGHDLLNKGLDQFIECLYLFNWRYRPHNKWLLEMAQDLEWTPRNFRDKLQNAQLVLEYSEDDIKRRVEVIKELWEELLVKLYQEGLPNDPFYFTSVFIDEDRQVLKHTVADKVIKEANIKDRLLASQIKDFINYLLVENIEELRKILIEGQLDSETLDIFNKEIVFLRKKLLNKNKVIKLN